MMSLTRPAELFFEKPVDISWDARLVLGKPSPSRMGHFVVLIGTPRETIRLTLIQSG